MKNRFLVTSLAISLVGGYAAAQDATAPQTKTHTESTTKQTGPGPDSKVKTESVHGTVKEYEAGKKIKISGPNDKTYSFDLDEDAKVDGTIIVGQMANVSYVKGSDGREHVAVVSAATRAAVGAATLPKSHTETTVKHEAPGMDDTKVKTETVIGVVKAFEAGKKIVVTGPKGKDYSFDLDENVSMTTPVAVGDRVKVSYKKGEAGEKVTVVARYIGKP
jgi:hypothetical protein